MLYLLSPAIIFRRRSFNYRHVLYIAACCYSWSSWRTPRPARVILLLYIALMASLAVSRKFGRRSSLLIGGIFRCGRGFDRSCRPSIYLPLVCWSSGPKRYAVWPYRDLAISFWDPLPSSPLLGIRILFLLAGIKGRVSEYHCGSPLGVRLCAQWDSGNMPAAWSSRYGPILCHFISGDR